MVSAVKTRKEIDDSGEIIELRCTRTLSYPSLYLLSGLFNSLFILTLYWLRYTMPIRYLFPYLLLGSFISLSISSLYRLRYIMVVVYPFLKGSSLLPDQRVFFSGLFMIYCGINWSFIFLLGLFIRSLYWVSLSGLFIVSLC